LSSIFSPLLALCRSIKINGHPIHPIHPSILAPLQPDSSSHSTNPFDTMSSDTKEQQEQQNQNASSTPSSSSSSSAAAAVQTVFDPSVSLEDVRRGMSDFATARHWEQYHTPRNLLLAMMGEVGELAEIFQWRGEVPPGLPGM
jgi:hypothetical protein